MSHVGVGFILVVAVIAGLIAVFIAYLAGRFLGGGSAHLKATIAICLVVLLFAANVHLWFLPPCRGSQGALFKCAIGRIIWRDIINVSLLAAIVGWIIGFTIGDVDRPRRDRARPPATD